MIIKYTICIFLVYLENANILPEAYKIANFLAFNISTGKYKADNENIKQLIDTQTIKPIILWVLLCKYKLYIINIDMKILEPKLHFTINRT